MVVRAVDRSLRKLTSHTDSRSPKLSGLRRTPEVTWLFHNHTDQVQLRIRATARVPEANQRNYLGVVAPGTVLDQPGWLREPAPPMAPCFAVIVTTVLEIDWLWLAPGGHRRARFRYGGGQCLESMWVEP